MSECSSGSKLADVVSQQAMVMLTGGAALAPIKAESSATASMTAIIRRRTGA